MYKEFVSRHNLMDEILSSRTFRNYFVKSKVFKNISSSAVIHQLAKNIVVKKANKGTAFDTHLGDYIAFLISGKMKLIQDGETIDTINSGDICGEAGILEKPDFDPYEVVVIEDSEYGIIDGKLIRVIPSIMWTILEIHHRRKVQS